MRLIECFSNAMEWIVGRKRKKHFLDILEGSFLQELFLIINNPRPHNKSNLLFYETEKYGGARIRFKCLKDMFCWENVVLFCFIVNKCPLHSWDHQPSVVLVSSLAAQRKEQASFSVFPSNTEVLIPSPCSSSCGSPHNPSLCQRRGPLKGQAETEPHTDIHSRRKEFVTFSAWAGSGKGWIIKGKQINLCSKNVRETNQCPCVALEAALPHNCYKSKDRQRWLWMFMIWYKLSKSFLS